MADQGFTDTELAALADIQNSYGHHDVNYPPSTPEQQQAYSLIGSILGTDPWQTQGQVTAPAIQRDANAWPEHSAKPYDFSQYLTAPSDGATPQYGMAGEGHFRKQTSNLQGGSGGWGGQYGASPRASDFDTLLALGASLLGGGNFSDYAYRASNVLGAQQAGVEHNAAMARQLHNSGPQAEKQKQQQATYQSRMNAELDNFIKETSNPYSPASSMSDEQKDAAYQTLVSKWEPLIGYKMPPRPSEVNAWFRDEAAPEMTHIDVVKGLTAEYGETMGKTAKLMLQKDPTNGPQKLLELQLKLEGNKTARAKIEAEKQKVATADGSKLIEEYRKRDLETHKGAAGVGGQFSGRTGDVPSIDALGLQNSINAFHDSQQAALRNGQLASPRQFFGSLPPDLSKKNYSAFAKAMMGGQGPMSPAVHGDVLAVPLSDATPERISKYSAEEKSRAIAVDNDTAKTLHIPPGQALLIRFNGQLGWAKSKPGI